MVSGFLLVRHLLLVSGCAARGFIMAQNSNATVSSEPLPYWRLSGFYFIYFAKLGTLLPYWSLYLQFRGFSPLEIGQLMSLLMATKIIGPNFWGWVADRTGQALWVLRAGVIAMTVSFLGVFWAEEFWRMAFVMMMFSFFWNAVLPQLEAIAFKFLGTDTHRYSMIRLWGSVGFVVMVLLGGWLVERFGVENLPHWIFIIMVLTALSAFCLPHVGSRRPGTSSLPVAKAFLEQARSPDVLMLLGVCVLMQFSHGPYYTFYTLLMERQGISPATIGWLWTFGVMAEVLLFALIPRWFRGVSAYWFIFVSLLLAGLRWTLTAWYPDQFGLMAVIQVLHAATYGAFHVGVITMIQARFSGSASQGQALYSSVTYGVGGALGALIAGMMWKHVSLEAAFLLGAAAALLGALLCLMVLQKTDFRQVKI